MSITNTVICSRELLLNDFYLTNVFIKRRADRVEAEIPNIVLCGTAFQQVVDIRGWYTRGTSHIKESRLSMISTDKVILLY